MLETYSKQDLKALQAAYAKASDFEKRGLLQDAARTYRLIIAKWPDATAHFNYGIILKKLGQFDDALRSYENAIACKPDYAEAHGNMGGIHQECGAYEMALACYEKTIRYNPLLVPGHYNQGVVLQKLHRPEDALAAYVKALALNPQYVMAMINAGSIFVDKQDFDKAIEWLSKAIQLQPTAVQAYCNRGVAYQKLRRYDDALADFQKAVALRPDYAEAHAYLGNLHLEKLDFQTARAHFDKALSLNPDFVEAYYNRGVALQELRRLEEALRDNDKALALDPNHELALLNKSVILAELKRKPEAAAICRQILDRDPENLKVSFNLALLEISLGDYPNGWARHESRLHLHAGIYRDIYHKPYWRGVEDIAGKTLLIKWEQGFGDTLQFCRYAKLAVQTGANIVLSVQDPLKRLIGSLDNGITVIGEHETPENFDYFTFLMTLPHAMGTTVETIPLPTRYLAAEPASISKWQARLDGIPARKIGLVWAGHYRPGIVSARRNDTDRSMPLERYLPLLDVAGAEFFSLQKGPPAAQLASLDSGHGIHDWTEDFTDFAETAALIENLDLVITVDTSVAHLAAALGKQVWILIPFVSCWRWLENRTDSPWYASVRLFRQSEHGNWDDVLKAVKQELVRLVAS